ncbi:MAG: hypothetical protein ACPGLY_27615, partial [Rubripirellula sp.]
MIGAASRLRPKSDFAGKGADHYAQFTTARVTHIMWLTNLAPDIQEAILFLPRVESGPDTVKEIDVRRIARVM